MTDENTNTTNEPVAIEGGTVAPVENTVNTNPEPLTADTKATTESVPLVTKVNTKVDLLEKEFFSTPNPNIELTLKLSEIIEKPTDKIQVPFILTGSKSFDAAREIISGVKEELRGQVFDENWAQYADASQNSFMKNNVFQNKIVSANTQWKQYVDADGAKIRVNKPMVNSTSDTITKLVGEKAEIKLRTVLGLGAYLHIPLWHTGIWLLLKSPSDSELLFLDQKLQHDKVTLGRETGGLIFSNNSAYIMDTIVTFILDHVAECSLKEYTVDKLKNIILVTDIPTLIWGIASTIYPNGYPFAFTCVTNPLTCQHVTFSNISIPRLQWMDNNGLTKDQKKHMSNRKALYVEDDIINYQHMGEAWAPKTINVRDNLKFTLSVPTLKEYFISAHKWVDEVTSTLDSILNNSMDKKEREIYIQQQAYLTLVRQYGHWVNKIVIEEETDDGLRESVIEDRDTLDSVMSTMSGEEDVIKSFTDAVLKYIEDSTVSVIAIPRFNCPKCQEPMSDEYSKHPALSIINVEQIFFILRHQRLFRIRVE